MSDERREDPQQQGAHDVDGTPAPAQAGPPEAVAAGTRQPTQGPEENPHRQGSRRWLGRLLRGPETEANADEDEIESPQRSYSVAANPARTGFGLAVGVAIAVLLWMALASLSQLLLWIAVALFIALGLEPIVRWFQNRGTSRTVGVLAVVVLMLGIAGGILGTFIPQLVSQITTLVQRTPEIINSVTHNQTIQDLDRQFHLVERGQAELQKFLKDSSAMGGVFNGVIGAGNLVGQIAFGTLIVMVLAIYFLVSMPALKAFAYSLAPRSKRRRAKELGEEITRSVGNYVIGQATVAACNAIFATIVMLILGVPYVALLSIVVLVLAFIPLVGGVSAGVVVILVTLFANGWQAAVIYAICYFAYLQFEAYFVSPKVMARAVKVPGAVVVVAVIAGGTLLGIAGALMAIPVAASVMLLIREVWIKRQDQL